LGGAGPPRGGKKEIRAPGANFFFFGKYHIWGPGAPKNIGGAHAGDDFLSFSDFFKNSIKIDCAPPRGPWAPWGSPGALGNPGEPC